MSLLEIKDLHANIEDKEILRGINLTINPGEVHAIMGPNGSGKSTLASVLAGREEYEVTAGEVTFDGKDLLDMKPEERAGEGLFLAFQYPVEIPGVNTQVFLRAAVNGIRKHKGEAEMSAMEFLKSGQRKVEVGRGCRITCSSAASTKGFSGGEKKRSEVFQMALLEPKMAVLDETDSGLDIDALRIVANGVNAQRSPQRSALVITHYQRLLDYIVPDFVHVLYQGRIIKSGGKELAQELDETGYDEIIAAYTDANGAGV